ncbi:hypothetical protein BDA99DRAFT_538943 [Phascolomyces articulosus]|uniref:Uncharacterized protein n=1 Tax=Phascolomyces articulosus TaxID=60185 RepID=A0AAD5JXH6_9FUNG|nr:hypothetical protein BDA99DRAFT_538943 [Phascolomyces articulosus]
MVRAIILLMMTLVTILPHCYVHAYCFYNQMSDTTEVSISQVGGQRHTILGGRATFFKHKNMPPGSKECCPYQNRECSKERSQGADCKFLLSYRKGPNEPEEKGNVVIFAPCGGYITAVGTYGDVSYHIFDTNNNQIGAGNF